MRDGTRPGGIHTGAAGQPGVGFQSPMGVNHRQKRCPGTGYLRRMRWRGHTLGGTAVVATQREVWESKWQLGGHVQRGRDNRAWLRKKIEQTNEDTDDGGKSLSEKGVNKY